METRETEIWGICTDFTRAQDNWSITLCDDAGNEYVILVHDSKVDADIECGKHLYARGNQLCEGESGHKPFIFANCVDRWGRYCSHCGQHHEEGYYSENTGIYACSDECLNAMYTQEEIEEERAFEWLFWTEWYN